VKAIALIVLLWPAVASGEPELSLRLSSWGSLSAGQGAPFDGLIGQIHVAPGVELGERAIFLSLFAGATTKVSSLSEQYWNNAVEPRLTGGARFALPLGALIREAWANLFLGGRYERFVYFTGAQMLDRRVAAFTELMFGLDWRCAGGSRRCTGRGAPLFARCELAIQSDGTGRGVQLTGYVQQAVDVARLAGGAVAPTVTVQLKQNDRANEYWNDVLELAAGIRWRAQATPLPSLYGSLTVELRGESRVYLPSVRPAEHRVLVLVGFGLFGRLAGVTL